MNCKDYIQILFIVLFTLSIFLYHLFAPHTNLAIRPFIASIDTMKVSRDTVTEPLSAQEISGIIKASASVHANYITVDTQWDYPEYMEQWIQAIRAQKLHIWFRIYPKQWEDTSNGAGAMTPGQYLVSEQRFIQEHASFFQPGDILDPCAEPEQGSYWNATYGANWANNAPNDATRAYNEFLRQTTTIADNALYKAGIFGVITTIRSVNSFIAAHPDVLEQATVDQFGAITVDSYPDEDTVIPAVAAQARVNELNAIEALWHVPIIIGEMGYSNDIQVSDSVQQAVLRAEFAQLQSLPYLVGMNYWVGPGSDTAGGYTYLITKKGNSWILRPAAYDLASFDLSMITRNSDG